MAISARPVSERRRPRGAPAAATAPRRSAALAPLSRIDLLRGSLVGLTLVSISAVHLYLGPLRSVRPALTLLALAVLLTLLRPRGVRWSSLRVWPALAVGGFALLAVGSTFFGISLGGSARYILDGYSRVLLVYVLMVVVVRDARDLAVQMWGYVVSIGVLIILAFTVLEVNTTDAGLDRLGGGATMYDANDLGMVALIALPIALLLFYASRTLGKVLSGAIILGIPLLIAMTGSRGAMLGLIAVGAALFFAMSRINLVKRAAVVGVLLFGLMLGASDAYWEQMRTLLRPSEDYNLADDFGRIAIAKRGFGYMLRYPLFGIGIGNFPRAEGTISPIASQLANSGEAVRWVAAHNSYVQVGSELGVAGLGLWLALLTGGSVGLLLRRARVPRDWERQSPERRFLREAMLFLPVSFIGFAVTTFFLSHAFTPPTYILFSFHAALLVLVQRELAADRRAARLAAAPPADPLSAARPR